MENEETEEVPQQEQLIPEPTRPDGYKEFGTPITRLTDKEIEEIINGGSNS